MAEEVKNAEACEKDAERSTGYSECVSESLIETTKELTLATDADTGLLEIGSGGPDPVMCNEDPPCQEDRSMNFESGPVRMAIYERLWQ